jgi:cytoplasmic tRNA 2-thiolation protein 2
VDVPRGTGFFVVVDHLFCVDKEERKASLGATTPSLLNIVFRLSLLEVRRAFAALLSVCVCVMSQCLKCKEAVGLYCSRDGVAKLYCSDCFTQFCTKLFRDALLMQCRMACDVPMAVAVSGGHSSMFMLHQLGLWRKQHELRLGNGKWRLVLLPFHLREDALVIPPSSLSRPVMAEEVAEEMEKQFDKLDRYVQEQTVQWQFAGSPLFAPGEVRQLSYRDFLSSQEIETLRDCVHHPKLSLTTREEWYDRLRRRILTAAAEKLIREWHDASSSSTPSVSTTSVCRSWKHLVVGDNAVRCSIATLRSIVQGETGDQVVHKSGFRGYVHDVVVMRPMRTLLPKEIVSYTRLHGIGASYSPALSTGTALRSIHRTLESFVFGLMQSYRAVVFNILNVTTKLGVQPAAAALAVFGPESTDEAKGTHSKHVVLSKIAHHHRTEIESHPPPSFSPYVVEEGTEPSQGARCLICGCAQVLPYATAPSSSKSVVAGLATTEQDAGPQCHLCYSCSALWSDCSGDSADGSDASLLNAWVTVASMLECPTNDSGESHKAVLSDADRAAYLIDDGCDDSQKEHVERQ